MRKVAKGPNHWNAKLSDQDVQHIKGLVASGQVSREAIGIHYNIHKSTISRIVNGRRRAK